MRAMNNNYPGPDVERFVYLAKGTKEGREVFKVGFSVHPQFRIAAFARLGIHNAELVYFTKRPNYRRLEAALHEVLPNPLGGECFDLPVDVVCDFPSIVDRVSEYIDAHKRGTVKGRGWFV